MIGFGPAMAMPVKESGSLYTERGYRANISVAGRYIRRDGQVAIQQLRRQ
jgi:hypothetical protein